MEIHPLYSSSSGNCCKVASSEATLLIDAGVSYKKILEASEEDDLEISALFITHEHHDHVAGAGVVGRKQGCPIYIPEESFIAKEKIFKNCDVQFIKGGDEIKVGDMLVKAYTTKHDSKASLGYTITDTGTDKKFGYLTDSGSISKVMRVALESCDAYFLEADYDQQMLDDYEKYDELLKMRISGPFGHLGNHQISEYIENDVDLGSVEWIAFGHLSSRTNTPDTVLKLMKDTFPEFESLFLIAPISEPLLL
jgi:phosphoribosyl 1,2-cyclic phosphodiesterase